jgi:amidase
MHDMTLHAISNDIRARRVSIGEVVAHQLERIERYDPMLSAFAHVDADGARHRAEQLSEELADGHWRGPLHGVPIAVKDIFAIARQPFEIGMPSRVGIVAEETATAVERLQAAGAIVLGRLSLTEGVYAEHIPPFPTPRNPWDLDSWSGSSSSGSGVATAAGLAFGTLASDTGGSIRIPASCTGVTGLKPTWGRVSRFGVFGLAATLDHPGTMARSAIDAGLLMEAIAGHDPRDPTSSIEPVEPYGHVSAADLRGTRLGVDFDWAFDETSPPVQQAMWDAIEVFESLGVEVIPMRFPDSRQIIEDWFRLCGVQAAHVHGTWFDEHADHYGEALKDLLTLGRSVSGADYQELILRRLEFQGRVTAALSNVDAMLLPGLPFPAPLAADMVQMDAQKVTDIHRFTVPFTMSQVPTLTMPGGFAADPRLPVAIQLVGSAFRERDLVNLGAGYQRHTDWHKQHPELP